MEFTKEEFEKNDPDSPPIEMLRELIESGVLVPLDDTVDIEIRVESRHEAETKSGNL